jgi:hypothetical protein
MTALVAAKEPSEPGALIKTDVLGRVHHTAEQRERILDEFERSAMSAPKFAELVGVKYQTFATWRQARKRQRRLYPRIKPQARTAAQVKWLEAVVRPGAVCGATLLLHFPGGVRAEITSAQQAGLAAALVRALEQPC